MGVRLVIENAFTSPLEHEPLPADEVVAGEPATGSVVLDVRGEHELGIWEMTPGTATDTEVDELFIVLSGRATVVGIAPEPLELVPGSIVRLTAGMRTTWTVHETLRKIYLI
ncbi:MAG: cupin domain-containing protein [Microbacteriaceae bacterium]|nr:cupin domain-containing protein [Microbacteriaceae bacterium]